MDPAFGGTGQAGDNGGGLRRHFTNSIPLKRKRKNFQEKLGKLDRMY
jgi:hypothetical protein